MFFFFYLFSTDEDARQAFQRNNGKIKEVQITLLLSSRTEMQKVIEAARSIQTPFMQQVVAKPAIIPPINPSQPITDKKEDSSFDSKSKDDRSKSSRSRRRSRSRSRDRDRKDRSDRDRSRDRSRDRRDRRRRDRSRSRERTKRRDRKDRSKSRERTRSKERDSRRSRDTKRRSLERHDDNNSNHSNTNDSGKVNPWEVNSVPRITPNVNTTQNSPGLLGNYPNLMNSNPLEEARRSLGLLTGIQNQNQNIPNQNLKPNIMSMDNGVNRTNILRSEWPMSKPQEPSLGQMFQQLQRPMLAPKDMNYSSTQRPMFHSSLGPRVPFNQDVGNGSFNRPFMNRPGMSDMLQNNRNSPDYTLKGNNFDNLYKRDYRSKNNERSEPSDGENCIQLQPYWGGYGDLRRFFHGLFISNTGIKVLREPNGKRNGIIYIKFVHSDSRSLALRKNGMSLRGNNMEILPISNETFDKYGPQDENDENTGNDSPSKKQPFTCLVVEDIPSFAKEHDMLKMFSDYSLLGIDIQNENRRRHAYIQFNKEEDAEKALEEINKHILGGKQLIVRACPEKQIANPILDEHPQDLQNEQPIEIDEDKDDMEIIEQHDNDASFDTDVILLTGMPPKTTDRDVIDFFSDIGLVPTRIHMVMNKFGPTGECYCEFSSADEAISALDKNGMPLGPANVNVEPYPRKEMEKNLGMTPNFHPHINPTHIQNRFAGRLGPRPMGMLPRPPFMPNRMMGPPLNRHESMMPLDPNIGPPGCVLALENVPYKAGVDEILHFFHNFQINHQSVMRRYNDNGTPTGDARVTFVSPSEAKRAFDECKFQKIRDRTIYLKLM